jgi:hypothetical protein
MLEQDKVYHFLSGMFISMTAAVGFRNPMLGLGLAALAGLVKEGIDWLVNLYYTRRGEPPRHDVDFWDFFWTCAGGAAGAMIVAIFDRS